MSDISDLVAVLGALDTEVARLETGAREAAQRRVAELIPPYGEPDMVGWYSAFVEAARVGSAVDLDDALLRLAGPTDNPGVPARRLAAIAAAARAFPTRYGPDGDRRHVSLRALTGPGILASAPAVGYGPSDAGASLEADTEQVLHTLAEPDVGSYAALRDRHRPRFHSTLPTEVPNRAARLVDTVVDGDVDPAAALKTTICVSGMRIHEARNTFLNPAMWAGCPGWCSMSPSVAAPTVAGVDKRFLEVVGLGCDTGDFELSVWLDFSPVISWGCRLVLAYWMSPPEVQHTLTAGDIGASGKVAIDEGSLAVVQDGLDLRITTTKRFRYTSEAIGRATFILASGAGYAEMGAAFIEQASGGTAHVKECD
jgi:hypothetical protein